MRVSDEVLADRLVFVAVSPCAVFAVFLQPWAVCGSRVRFFMTYKYFNVHIMVKVAKQLQRMHMVEFYLLDACF